MHDWPAGLAAWIVEKFRASHLPQHGARGAGRQKTAATASRRSHRWQIYMLRSEAHHLGVVEAADIRAAVEIAIEKFSIAEGERRKIFARRVD